MQNVECMEVEAGLQDIHCQMVRGGSGDLAGQLAGVAAT